MTTPWQINRLDAAPIRVRTRSSRSGEVLQTIELDRGCFACMLGGGKLAS